MISSRLPPSLPLVSIQLSFGERNTRRRSSVVFLRQKSLSDGASIGLKHPVKVGTPIRALYRGGPTWYDGIVSNARSDGTYDVLYTDGDRYVRWRTC